MVRCDFKGMRSRKGPKKDCQRLDKFTDEINDMDMKEIYAVGLGDH
jgi:hypothetical protein